MGNPWAGEVTITLDGEPQTMKLTLGALAELEAGLGEDSLLAMVGRFESGACSTADLVRLLHAGLRGGGWRGTLDDLLNAEIEGGMVAAIACAASMLALSFGTGGAS